jgi:ADP-heptose:LPS heptosyltransferase
MDLDVMARSRGERLRILVTRLRYLGDVILTTPAVAALKSRYPEARIDYLTEEPYGSVLQGNPHLDTIITTRGAFLGTVMKIRKRRYTAAVDLFYNPRSAWLLYLSRIPIRVGGLRRLRRKLYTHTFTVPAHIRSELSRHLHPLRILEVMEKGSLPRVYIDDGEREMGRSFLEEFAGSSNGFVALHCGGTWQAKRWNPERFALLADMILDRTGKRSLLVTGPGEERIVHAVLEHSRSGRRPQALPVMSIRVLASLLLNCDAVVANDGGVMHLSVALGRPTVGVFGPTEPDIWFPYQGEGPFAVATVQEGCAPCHKHECGDPKCLDRLGPDLVFEKLEDVISWRA